MRENRTYGSEGGDRLIICSLPLSTTYETGLSIKAGNEMAIIPRVLHLGANAEIISPASARKQMRQIAKELTKIYKE